MSNNTQSNKQVDVLLILEGTFPYVSGGVSMWVDQIIRGMPELNFGAIFLGSKPEDYPKQYYELPNNLIYFKKSYLFAEKAIKLSKQSQKTSKSYENKIYESIKSLHNKFTDLQEGKPVDFKNVFFKSKISGNNIFDQQNFLRSETAWNFITSQYDKLSLEPSFIDYFWTVRNIHSPLWLLDKIASTSIKPKIVHAPSTGYAGFLGSLISQYYHVPLIVTEHGLYTRERYLELIAAPLVKHVSKLEKLNRDIDYLNTMWLKFFDTLARICYQQANKVVSLYPGARRIQIASGADPKKTQIIGNGINIDKFSALAATKTLTTNKKKVVGLIGRLVRIKFTLNYIRAIGILSKKIPNIEGWICFIGHEEEDYISEAKLLVNTLNLQNVVKFVEGKPAHELLKDIDLLAVTSVSEGMPLNMLEAFAAGVPVVTANVGACAEMVVGTNEKDRALGACGIVVPPGNVEKLGQAMISLLSSEEEYQKASQVAQQRVKNLYDEKKMVLSYYELYQGLLK